MTYHDSYDPDLHGATAGNSLTAPPAQRGLALAVVLVLVVIPVAVIALLL